MKQFHHTTTARSRTSAKIALFFALLVDQLYAPFFKLVVVSVDDSNTTVVVAPTTTLLREDTVVTAASVGRTAESIRVVSSALVGKTKRLLCSDEDFDPAVLISVSVC